MILKTSTTITILKVFINNIFLINYQHLISNFPKKNIYFPKQLYFVNIQMKYAFRIFSVTVTKTLYLMLLIKNNNNLQINIKNTFYKTKYKYNFKSLIIRILSFFSSFLQYFDLLNNII